MIRGRARAQRAVPLLRMGRERRPGFAGIGYGVPGVRRPGRLRRPLKRPRGVAVGGMERGALRQFGHAADLLEHEANHLGNQQGAGVVEWVELAEGRGQLVDLIPERIVLAVADGEDARFPFLDERRCPHRGLHRVRCM